MRTIPAALLTGAVAVIALAPDAGASVFIEVRPDIAPVVPSSSYSLDLYMTVEVGTRVEFASFSVACDVNCEITHFLYNESFFDPGKIVVSGTPIVPLQNGLNTTGSMPITGGGTGAITSPTGPGNYAGSIGFPNLGGIPGPPVPPIIQGDGTADKIGTLTVHVLGPGAVVSPQFRVGEGLFNGPVEVPTEFASATLGVPEPATALLLGAGLAALALGRRRRAGEAPAAGRARA